MPVMQPIVLKDAQTPTPVSHSYDPMSLRNDLGTYVDKTGTNIRLRNTLTMSVRPATTSNQGHKVTVRLQQPLVTSPVDGECCTPQGAPIPHNQVVIEFLRNNTASDAQTNDLLAYLQDLVKDPQFVAVARGESLR